MRLLVLPDGETILAGAGNGSILRSSNAGLDWKPVWKEDFVGIHQFLALSGGETVFATGFTGGILSSLNNGEDWESVRIKVGFNWMVPHLGALSDGKTVLARGESGGIVMLPPPQAETLTTLELLPGSSGNSELLTEAAPVSADT
ncbi:WD40/YVTN/BNR-like repeat-containing protein [Amaricoccus tamworthensis]|uniref:WD40/YVTN/BNR-like repeat-containing protein n=1 Tax=Amaricoccus tamworthensis TaxID=57002 RepID=UPI003C7AF65F